MTQYTEVISEPTIDTVTDASLYVIDQVPTELSYLQNNDFVIRIHRAPHINYFVQGISIPGITLPGMPMPTQHATIPIESNRPLFDNLSVTFKIDEEMINYLQTFNWIMALGKPRGFPDIVDRFGEDVNKPQSFWNLTHLPKYSDISVFIQSSIKNPKLEFIFRDAWPIAMSAITFDTTLSDTTYATATVFFTFSYMDIARADGQPTDN